VVPEQVRRSPFTLAARSSKTLDDRAIIVPTKDAESAPVIQQETANG